MPDSSVGQLSAQSVAIRDRGGTVLGVDSDEIGVQNIGGTLCTIRQDGSITPLAVGDSRAVMAAEAAKYIGTNLQLDEYKFNSQFWEIQNNTITGGAIAQWSDGMNIDGSNARALNIGANGGGAGSAILRVIGTDITTQPTSLLLANVTGAAAKAQHVPNPAFAPWTIWGNWRPVTAPGSLGNSQHIICALTCSNVDPSSVPNYVGLVYTGGSLKIWAVNGSNKDQINTGWVSDGLFHRFALASTGGEMVALVDGVQQGLSLSSYEWVGLVNGGNSWLMWGQIPVDAVNYQSCWSSVSVATRTEV
jgi:hypothetical protein